jgi:hypothetical protein
VHRGPGAPKPGDDVRVTLDVDELHWFAGGHRVEA